MSDSAFSLFLFLTQTFTLGPTPGFELPFSSFHVHGVFGFAIFALVLLGALEVL